MANYAKKFYYVTQAQYEILQSGGTITVGDQTYTGIDPNAIYFVRPVADLYQIKWNANTDRLELWKNGVAVEGGEDAVRIGYATYSAMSGDSNKLNGEDPSYYLDYANFTGAPSLANYVNKTSNETVGGVKTFTETVTAPTFVGALTGNATTATTATKLGTSTVGSTQLPIYLNKGTATAITQENLRKGVFGTTAIGSASQPIYLAANGVPTAGNTIPTVYNSTLTITAGNGLTTGGTFTTNQSSASAVTVTLGTPGNITTSSTNSVSSTSHTHALVLPQSIATTATPSFSGIGLGAGTQTWQITDSGSNLLFQAGTTPVTRATLYNNGDLTITGKLSATSKSFLIDHPTKPGYKLQYGSLEGPENGVYVRGRLTNSNIIELPEYWANLVDEDSITVTLTAIGKAQKLFVKDIKNNKIYIKNSNRIDKNINCFYVVYGERKDVDRLEVEMEVK